MKIGKISITNFRGIKDPQIIDNIGNNLILTGVNNAGKSVVLNALSVFLDKGKAVQESDFYKGENNIEISVDFSEITDEYLLNFCSYKCSRAETRSMKSENPELFSSFTKDEIKNRLDLENEGQIQFIEKRWIEKFKSDNNIVDGKVTVQLIIQQNLSKTYSPSLEAIFPVVIFIDDERDFSNEEVGGSGSITKKFFEGQNFKNYEDISGSLDDKKAKDLSLAELELLLQNKSQTITQSMGELISNNFKEYYNSDYSVKIKPTTSISHKNFSLQTVVDAPGLEGIPLGKLGAGLRALYILSLLKAYYSSSRTNKNIIFLIEEPELYLHPGLQKEISNILRNISEEQQVFFTTHSPIILKLFDLENIKAIEKEDNKTTIKNSDLNTIIEKLGFSLMDIVKYKYIIFVEGRDDRNILRKIIEKFYPEKSSETEIITANTCGNLAFYASFKFLGLLNTDKINYLIIRDNDNRNADEHMENFKTQLESKDIPLEYIENYIERFKILDRYSIENFFFDTQKILAVFPGFSKEKYISALDECETCNKPKESIKQGNEVQFLQDLEELKDDFNQKIKTMRGHNIFNALIYYVNGNEKRFLYDKDKIDEFINNYISQCENSDFGVINDYLKQLYN